MEPFHIHDQKDDDPYESEEIIDLLPPRFREISGSSTATESFNLMNNDLISQRIIPTLHSRLRSLIPHARPGLIANRLRRLVDSAPQSPRECRLLFRVIPKEMYAIGEMKFINCAIRDKRLSPLPYHEFTALTIPHWTPTESFSGQPYARSFVEAIGDKIIFWNRRGRHHFCYILNADHNSDRAFRELDTSTINQQLRFHLSQWITKAIVGDRLIVLLSTTNGAFMLSLDVKTERWSLLPECPQEVNRNLTPIPWKGKLYLVDINSWVNTGTNDTTQVVPMHFDFQRNMWVIGAEENTAFALSFMSFFPRYESPKYEFRSDRKLVRVDNGRCMISSKSGTLYAISHAPENVYDMGDSDEYPVWNIYFIDDLTRGWRQMECRKSEHTLQVDPFKLTKLRRDLPEGEYLHIKMNCWEMNEHDILLVVLQSLNLVDGLWARYAWWIFNKEDGVKSYGQEDLSRSVLENISDISLLKFES